MENNNIIKKKIEFNKNYDIKNNTCIEKPRCYECKKKLGLFYIKCRCNHIFCNEHRYSTDHNCKYNYFEEHKNNLNKINKNLENINNKIEKI